MVEIVTAADARRWAVATRALLAAHRSEIDRLNVYPVPDGDTGTNLYLTFDAALAAVVADHERRGVLGRASLVEDVSGIARAMLLSARGNSGVILSQLLGGFAEAVAEAGADAIDASLLTNGMRKAAEAARRAVVHPVEGTILTVADDVARVAQRAASAGVTRIGELVAICHDEALASLRRTPELLEVLRDAGVVDAGAAGYVLVLEALRRVLEGGSDDLEDPTAGENVERRALWGVVGPGTAHGPLDDGVPESHHAILPSGPAYEVMYLLDESDATRVDALRERLDVLGDSLLVIGGPALWNIHVHVDDPGAAVEAALAAGRPHRIRISHFATRLAQHRAGVGVVACAAGPGIRTLLEAAGAVVVASGPGGRASTRQLLDAVLETGARSVIVLPNDRDTLMAAQVAATAARAEGVAIHVVPSRTVVQGIAAMAVFDPDAPAPDNAVAMAQAAAATRHGGVTVAAREGLTMAGRCSTGDVLGIIDGDFALIGDDLGAVAEQVLDRLLSDPRELVTIVTGVDAPAGLGERVAAAARSRRGLDVTVVDGGQPYYPLLMGVE